MFIYFNVLWTLHNKNHNKGHKFTENSVISSEFNNLVLRDPFSIMSNPINNTVREWFYKIFLYRNLPSFHCIKLLNAIAFVDKVDFSCFVCLILMLFFPTWVRLFLEKFLRTARATHGAELKPHL